MPFPAVPARGGRPGPNDKALAFAQCMRSHGVPAFPDPGNPVGNDVDENSPQFLRASKLCDKLGHNPQGQMTAARQQQLLSRGLKLATYMRQHGVPVPRPHWATRRRHQLQRAEQCPPVASVPDLTEDLQVDQVSALARLELRQQPLIPASTRMLLAAFLDLEDVALRVAGGFNVGDRVSDLVAGMVILGSALRWTSSSTPASPKSNWTQPGPSASSVSPSTSC